MLTLLKQRLRNNDSAVKIYRFLKAIVISPLELTPLRVLELQKVPWRDFFKVKKIALLQKVRPYTKNGYPRLSNIFDLANEMEERKIEGAFVECGVWKGGLCAVMGAVAHEYGGRRKTWYLDSFEGMPQTASPLDGEGTEEIAGDVLKASVSDVEAIVFNKLGLSRENNIIVKGWFEETLPRTKGQMGPIAILRLDADWYEATKLILDELYDQVVPGGYLVFDDYGRWQGCRKAVDEFLSQRGIKPQFHFVGWNDGERKASHYPPMYFKKAV